MIADMGVLGMSVKPKADSTLQNMRKSDLIEYIRCLEHNHNALAWMYENQVRLLDELAKDKKPMPGRDGFFKLVDKEADHDKHPSDPV